MFQSSDPGVRSGIFAMVGACVIWGLSPIYYGALAHVAPMEILAHRTLWSLVFFVLVLAWRGRFGALRAVLQDRRAMAWLAAAALLISANWFLFIWSSQTGRVVQASLGYYIFPLVAVVLGRLVYGERLSPLAMGAVALAALAVVVLTVGLGQPPWVALALAGTFGGYGVIKKRVSAGPIVSVTVEVLLLAPFAALWLWGATHWGWRFIVDDATAGAFGRDWRTTLMLIGAGPVTAVPLVLFSTASQRVPMATVGLVQYLNPTLQLLCGVLVFDEALTLWHGVALPMIWSALALYTIAMLRRDR